MLRQNRSEGSSTSRSFAKTALLRARRKTFQFSDEQCPWHIFFAEPTFPHSLGSDRGPESGPPGRHTVFEGTTFPHARPSSPAHRGSLANWVPGKASRSARRVSFRVSFRGTDLPRFPRPIDRQNAVWPTGGYSTF